MKYLVLFLCFLSVGCTKTVWVSERNINGKSDPYRSVAGIPFYTKKEVFDQKTTYKQTWLKATLTVERQIIEQKGGKEVVRNIPPVKFVKNVSRDFNSELNKLKARILDSPAKSIPYLELVDEFEAIDGLENYESIKAELVSNSFKSSWIVDEDSEYFLNAPLPWFGTGSLTQTINDNGTLAEAASTPDTKLADGLTKLIPFSDLITAEYITEPNEKTDAVVAEEITTMKFNLPNSIGSNIFNSGNVPRNPIPDPDPVRSKTLNKVTLLVSETGYLYDCVRQFEDMPENKRGLLFETECQEVTRTVIQDPVPTTTINKPKEPEGNKIAITGSIVIPSAYTSAQ